LAQLFVSHDLLGVMWQLLLSHDYIYYCETNQIAEHVWILGSH